MAIVPPNAVGKVEFFEQHLQAWTDNAEAIGLTSAIVASIADATAAARDAYNEQQILKNQSMAATAAFHDFVSVMAVQGAEAIAAIKLKAAQTNDPNVYTLAQIPMPKQPSPAPALRAPTDLVADPNADGTVSLSWKGTLAYGAFFSVWRKLGTASEPGPWVNLGSLAAKTFTDTTIPTTPAPAAVTYAIRAQRADEVSSPGTAVQVTFGGPGIVGGMTEIAGTIDGSELSKAA